MVCGIGPTSCSTSWVGSCQVRPLGAGELIGVTDEFSAAARSLGYDSRFDAAARPRSMGGDAGPVAHPQARLRRAGKPARAAPVGADRLLLPDARLIVRSRGRRPGVVHPGVAR